jgi:hypothetical protein
MSVLKLKTPIIAHGVTISELTFRKPVGKDLILCGYPFKITGRGNEVQRSTDMQSVAGLISELAQIPPSSVGSMSWDDLQEAMGIVLGFLAPTQPEADS